MKPLALWQASQSDTNIYSAHYPLTIHSLSTHCPHIIHVCHIFTTFLVWWCHRTLYTGVRWHVGVRYGWPFLSIPRTLRAYSHQRRAFFSAAGILLRIYQNPIHLNGAHWRTTFFRRRNSRCLQTLVRQRVLSKCIGFWYIHSRISAAEKTRVFGVKSLFRPKTHVFFRRVLFVPEHSHLSRKTLDAACILVLL